LPAHLRQPLLDGRFDLPQVGGLADKQRALGQLGKEVALMRAKVRKDLLVGGELEVFAAEFHGDHFFVAQGGRKPAPAQRGGVFDHLIVLTDQTVDGNDKIIPIH
jgi:hypothetical protein